MDQPTTLFLLTFAAAMGGLALWQSSRTRPFGTVALFPWTGLLFTALVAALVLVVHLMALAGLHISRPSNF